MAQKRDSPSNGSFDDPDWDARLMFWQRKLGRIRLGVEPVEEQVARYRRVTWMLTALSAGVALMIVALFTAFGRPDVGMIVAVFMFVPVVVIAWIDHGLLRLRVARFARELTAHEQGKRVAGGL